MIMMYLKEITATGFKSFADKLSITLDDKVTCIVGPNGSGKSNIVDAVRWVLGEQSVKNLRGDGSMSDVIFAGSKNRKESNVASVSLVFDNRDHYLKIPYTEVSIKRRVYRSGENEYFLNGEKCRLKDITDLFLDSGIGKAAFNIISQGEVQRILSNSPSDRRVVFEEAAGVLKYKKRKEEAMRKLERTRDNLDRVHDIIEELEVQVKPLQEQSIKAKEYLENKKGLDQYEVALLVYDIEEKVQEYDQDKEKIDALSQELLMLSNQSSSRDVKIEEKKKRLLQLEKELDTCNRTLLQLTQEVEKINSQKKLLKERSKYDKNSEMIQQTMRELKEQQGKVQAEVAVLENDIYISQEELNKIRKDSNDCLREIENQNQKKAVIEKEFAYQQKERLKWQQKAELLQQEIDNGGNMPNSVKVILKQSNLKGIHDCLENLIATEDVYTKALEIALASSKHFIVTKTSSDAKEAISYLKQHQLGRATFFPLEVIKPKGIDPDTMSLLKQDPNFIGVFSDLVHFDQQYRNIVLNQLGNVVVARNLDSANHLSQIIHQRYKIITLDGDVVHVGGSMTGGTYYGSKSIITLKQEYQQGIRKITALDQSLMQLTTDLDELNQTIKKLEQKSYAQKASEIALTETLRNRQNQFMDKKNQQEEIIQELNSLKLVEDSALSEEEERIIALYYEKVSEKEKQLALQKSLMKEEEKIKSAIEEEEATDRLHNVTFRSKEQELKDLEIKVSKLDVQLDHMLNTLSEEHSLTFEKAKETYVLDIEVEEARTKVAIYKDNIKHLGMVNLAAIDEYERVNGRYEFLMNQRNDLLKAQDTLLEIMNEMDQVMQEEFLKTFEQIEREFKQVFSEMFQGGQATLKLTQPDNLLETGIEIIVSPPGKRLTTISLLSGGEKTLTAISLLFAILNVRTIPFCLFDEVEAALDEVNVAQFGKYLSHYKSKTQFLIITHKKKTMEYADTLYGITMQEAGVSKLVSVKLNDKEETIG